MLSFAILQKIASGMVAIASSNFDEITKVWAS